MGSPKLRTRIMKKFDHIVLSIFGHHEYYPPTINAITNLAANANNITVIARNVAISKWSFPDNVTVQLSGDYIPVEDSVNQSLFTRIRSFLNYAFLLKRTIKQNKPDLVVLHDPMALFAHWAVAKVRGLNYKLWYHNHDVIEPGSMRKYSVLWFAEKYQVAAFKEIDIFTLPTEARFKYFPPLRKKSTYFTVHNYPAKGVYEMSYQEKVQPIDSLKLLYQGIIRPGHGLEAIINLLDLQIVGRDISLTILGIIPADYKQKLIDLADEKGVRDRLSFIDRMPYSKLPNETRKYDIGLAIHEEDNIQYKTGGLASNKIYEYAALGLPVFYFDKPHYTDVLKSYNWALPVKLDKKTLTTSLETILVGYESLSRSAHQDFLNKNNFEYYFSAVLNEIH